MLNKLPKQLGLGLDKETAIFTRDLVEYGLRAQAIPGNLLTGQLYISLNATKVSFELNARPLVLPTINGGLDRLQEQIASIVGKVDKMPLVSIAEHLDSVLSGMNNTLQQVNGQMLPAANQTLRQMNLTAKAAQNLLAED